jgi:hypothetical protein
MALIKRKVAPKDIPSQSYNKYGVSYCLSNLQAFDSQAELVSYLLQLKEEEFVTYENGTVALSWERLYELLTLPEHTASVPLLGLPQIHPIAPNLESFDGLTDSSFSITISGWRQVDGTPLGRGVRTIGAIAEWNDKQALLPEASWRLFQEVKNFASATEKTGDSNRRHWGKIRGLALAANAGLDNFLTHTVVLTPEKLDYACVRPNMAMPGWSR